MARSVWGKTPIHRLVTGWAIACLLLLVSCSSGKRPFQMTLAHLNDTHSHLEAVPLSLTVGNIPVTVEAGGIARLRTALDRIRSKDPEALVLHAGDAVQGTLYFTCFDGTLDFDFLNRLGIDAMTFGNHEFDRGTAPIPTWIDRSRFPWISTNIDFSEEPAIADRVTPFWIKTLHGEPVAVIGVTTQTTPQLTISPGKALFQDPIQSVQRQADQLSAAGINKIILLSHLGYEEDKRLGQAVSGIDIIVGGHSHTLLGDRNALMAIGLEPEGPYPTEVRAPDGTRVLVLQAWKWGLVLGRIEISLSENGHVTDYRAFPVIPIGEKIRIDKERVGSEGDGGRLVRRKLLNSGMIEVIPEDPTVLHALKPYTASLETYRTAQVAVAAEDLPVGLNGGPGPLAADSMRKAVPDAQVAVLNFGGVRKGLAAGPITLSDVLEVLPFRNSLVLVSLTGAQLRQTLEDGVEFLTRRYGSAQKALPYLSGAVMKVCPAAPYGNRIREVFVEDHKGALLPVDDGARYRIVVNSFVAGGGDGFTVIRNAADPKIDTGIIDSDAFAEYLRGIKTVGGPQTPCRQCIDPC